MKQNNQEFSQSVIEQIGYYVYLLIDPITDEIFYVGKGVGNRVFAHISNQDSTITEKRERITEIQQSGQQVRHIILRHGLADKEAFEVEAAAIDLLGINNLTNLVSGQGSNERGWMTAHDIIAQYDAKPIDIQEPALLIIINRRFRFGMTPEELYDATRRTWVLGSRRELVKYVFSVYRGTVREVYRIHSWYPVKARSEKSRHQARWAFDGEIAYDLRHLVGGSVDHYISKGSQNPCRYLNCD